MTKLQRYHIPSGSYHVGHKSAVLLQAYLGTCVGVAAYDANAGVGGLIHLLLPEPVSGNVFGSPAKYASTGIPAFLEALYAAGASPENLRACIAGGSLVGPINEQDLGLDIGGRTADRALQILEDERIPVEVSETGGFFTCCLNLDMLSMTPSIEPGVSDHGPLSRVHIPPDSEDIDRVIRKLQPIPQIALKVLRMINDEGYTINAIAEEIRKDQVISAKVLKYCNSPIFSTLSRIESLDEALIRMGQDFLVQSVLSLSVKQLFNQCDLGYSLCKGGLFYHAVGTAIVAEKIARITGTVPPSRAYTSGLLHDIGKVVLDQYVSSSHPLFYRKLVENSEVLTTEQDVLGITHTETGRRLACQWKFPDSLKESIYYHHDPDESGDIGILTHIVYIADLLMSRFNSGLELERIGAQNLSESMKKTGLSCSKFVELIDLIPGQALKPVPESHSMTHYPFHLTGHNRS